MKKRIVLLTNHFPFGQHEASFIRPEIPYLLEKYDLTIITKNHTDQMTTELGEKVDVYRYIPQYTSLVDIIRNYRWVFSKDFFEELSQNGGKNITRLIRYLVRASHFARFVEQIRKKYNQPVIYYSFWNDYAAYGIAKLCEKNQDKCVSRIHGGDLYKRKENGFYQPFKRVLARKLDRVIFISKEGIRYFVENYAPESERNLICCYMGISNKSGIMNQPSTDGILRLLSVSNLNEGKRVERIAAALAMISEIRIEWTHLGDGPTEKYVKEQAYNLLSSKKNISYRFLGRLSNDEVKKYYETERVDALLNVSISEGLPVSMMEAASYGVPLIGTNVGGVSEIIQIENGILIEKDFTDIKLADILRYFCKLDNNTKEKMRECSYKVWKTTFDASINYIKLVNEMELL